jgi:hypothetical protein
MFGRLDDPCSAIARMIGERDETAGLWPARDAPNRVIAGEILLADQAGDDGHGVQVTLKAEQRTLRKTVTGVFGDFVFDGLEPDAEYTLEARCKGYIPLRVRVRTVASQNIGALSLRKPGQAT